MKENINKDLFISNLVKGGATNEQAQSMWKEFDALCSKMSSTKKDYNLSLEECYVIIESLMITKMTGLGTVTGNDLIHKFSVFLNENKVTPPNETDIEDLVIRTSTAEIAKIDNALSSIEEQNFNFPTKKKTKSYLN